MRFGNLRRSVSIQTEDTDLNAAGEYDGTYTEIAQRRASIEPLTGKEWQAKSGENAEVSTRIRLRYDSTLAALKPHSRIVDISRSPNVVYDVISVVNYRERDREIICMCIRDG
jgi:head-tail adaptor